MERIVSPRLFAHVVLLVACLALPSSPRAAVRDSVTDAADQVITTYYTNILGRAPDSPGAAFWKGTAAGLQVVGAGPAETWRVMALQFYASPEFASRATTDEQFVASVYRTVYGREADSGGLAFWTESLANGLPRDAVLADFLFAPEFDDTMRALFGDIQSRAEVALVIDYYRGFLGRLPDAAGLVYWRDRLREAQCSGLDLMATADEMSASFLGSPEYAALARDSSRTIAGFYDAFLHRGADLDGLRFWQGRLQPDGLDGVRRAFLQSPEFQGHVATVAAQGCAKLSDRSDLALAEAEPGPSPFLAALRLRGNALDHVVSVTFTIAPLPGSASRPVHASYTDAYLRGRGYGPAAPDYRIPVFGLYQSWSNTVGVQVAFDDGSLRSLDVSVATPAWTDPSGVYDAVEILKPRVPGTRLDFDYFFIKSILTGPLVLDSDGEVRWWAPSGRASGSAAFRQDTFVSGDPASRGMRLLRLDGTATDVVLDDPSFLRFGHNVDPGKRGLLAEMDVSRDGLTDLENVIAEVDLGGTVLRQWSLGDIISIHMRARGDDPTAFVELGRDWFHVNAATYDPGDDSLIVSSRENFLVKIDYATGAIRWILGDPTKYWYSFPSLRELSLTLDNDGLYPIGQHAVSVTGQGRMMVFNNGTASISQPAGAPVGDSRTYSAVSEYEVDEATRTAREIYRFDNGQSIYSGFCSSVYRAGSSLLVNYAVAERSTRARILALDPDANIVFEMRFRNPRACDTSWNSVPVPFHDLSLQ